jgi:hypothetical protein
MKSSNHRVGLRVGNLASRTTTHFQMVESSEDKDGGLYRIRTYDFHRVARRVLTFSAPQAARIPTEPRFGEVSSVGSSHNRPTSAEDNEEA